MFISQLVTNLFLFSNSLFGILINRKSVLVTLMSIELLLLSLNLNFNLFSIYLDDLYGQIFSLNILTVAAAESAVGLAIIILYYRLYGHIYITHSNFALVRY